MLMEYFFLYFYPNFDFVLFSFAKIEQRTAGGNRHGTGNGVAKRVRRKRGGSSCKSRTDAVLAHSDESGRYNVGTVVFRRTVRRGTDGLSSDRDPGGIRSATQAQHIRRDARLRGQSVAEPGGVPIASFPHVRGLGRGPTRVAGAGVRLEARHGVQQSGLAAPAGQLAGVQRHGGHAHHHAEHYIADLLERLQQRHAVCRQAAGAVRRAVLVRGDGPPESGHVGPAARGGGNAGDAEER